MKHLFVGTLILPDQELANGWLMIEDDRIVDLGSDQNRPVFSGPTHQAAWIAPGFVDLHVHGGWGADFMDGTSEAFWKVIEAHTHHGTTTIFPTNCVAPKEQILLFLQQCRDAKQNPKPGFARVGGAHFYGPYFGKNAAGCHPKTYLTDPESDDFTRYFDFQDVLSRATVAPELPGAELFARACIARGIGVNLGHSHCTWDHVQQAITWGATHVDHLFCAMSDRARLRQSQPFPMRGGLLEATLTLPELTTEVIADGKHLAPELLQMAWQQKGIDRLALVTDCSRALDMPEGIYWFGTPQDGEQFQ